jgi:nucleotide-binding universal stress UspA family protein
MNTSHRTDGPATGELLVVGYDGSIQAGTAVDWAAAEAWRRGGRLLVTSVSEASRDDDSGLGHDVWPSTELQAARRVAEEGAERARKAFPRLETLIATPYRHAAEALVELSRGTDMLVIGPSGHRNLVGTLFGSVALAAIAEADCPVVVVRGHSARRPGPDGPVVLGVDGSTSCQAATDFAARMAAESGASLKIVHAWHAVPVGGFVAAYWPEAQPSNDQMASDAMDLLRAVSSRVLERHPTLVVRTEAVQAHPVTALPAAAGDAALLVVGARGLGGFAGLMLGSVSRGVVSSADCPVAVVRGRH